MLTVQSAIGVRTTAAMLTVAMALSFACTRHEATQSQTSATKKAALIPLKVNFNTSLSYAALIIALDEGYFKEEGLDVQLQSMDQNSGLLALTSGRIDVLITPLRSGLLNVIARGASMQLVADSGHSEPGACSSEVFAAPPDMADRLERTGYRGAKIVLIAGGMTEYLIDGLLAEHHVTRDDVTFVERPPNAQTFTSRQLFDAVQLTSEPAITNWISKGEARVLESSELAVPGHQHSVVCFGPNLLHGDHAVGTRFMRGYLRGVQRYNEGKTQRNIDVISAHIQLPKALIEKVCLSHIYPDGKIHTEAVEKMQQWAIKRHYQEVAVPVAKWWNPSFLDEAAKGLQESSHPRS